MTEYITKEAALEAIAEAFGDVATAEDNIRALPPIWRKRGRWVIEPGIGKFCSKCNFDIGNDFDAMEYVTYCPNCGAYMRDEEQDENNDVR